MASITKARFAQLAALGKRHDMPSFTHTQVNQWQEARETRLRNGGPFTVLVTGTDGCARHIVDAVVPYLEMLARNKVRFVEEPIGWEAMKRAGLSSPLDNVSARFPEKTWLAAMESDAILFCAVGSEWDDPNQHPEIVKDDRPQEALLTLRKAFDLFANIRPAVAFPGLGHLSPLRPELTEGMREITVVRELTRGLYFGEPKGYVQPDKTILRKPKSGEAVDTMAYTTEEIARVVRVAFELARSSQRSVTSLDKANALVSGSLWREVATSVAKEYPDVSFRSLYADDGIAKLVGMPKEFGVVVAENMFGDIAGDVLGVVTGGTMGLVPSAGFGDGSWPNYFEPVHGSAPDIFPASGKLEDSVANPLATVLTAEMLFRSLGLDPLAQSIKDAVGSTLREGWRTPDIYRGQPGEARIGTLAMMRAINTNTL